MENVSAYTQAIQRVYKDLVITTIEPLNHGQNNTVLKVNGSYIFRFPKYTEGYQALKREITLLEYLQDKLPLATPCPTFSCLSNQSDAFMGYPNLSGVPLWNRVLTEADDATKNRIAQQLGSFLKCLHQLPVTDKLRELLPQTDTASYWNTIFEQVRSKLMPHMRTDAQIQVANHFETFLEQPSPFAYSPVLKHGDFGASNILIDPIAGSINGILDFGSSSLGDPAYDFAGLLSSYDASFVRHIGYHYPNFDALWSRIRFYQGTFALLEALFGIDNSDVNAFKDGMALYW
ncbi:MAG: aminoglycoside phosphotransferase family protein [Cyanobacteria bacterium P01_H01_bin.21]